jgi:hypothetical protein
MLSVFRCRSAKNLTIGCQYSFPSGDMHEQTPTLSKQRNEEEQLPIHTQAGAAPVSEVYLHSTSYKFSSISSSSVVRGSRDLKAATA